MIAKILFVDDEKRILRGIRRTMLLIGESVECRFANSGEEALKLLEEQEADIIISDMKMPGMDGAELLEIVKEKWPSSFRIIMSGQSEKEHTIKALGLTHQYLAKPCESEKLKEVLKEFTLAMSHLSNKKLAKSIASIGSLPTQPKLYKIVVEELKSENASIKTIGDIVAKDAGMTAQILKLVNSAYFGITNQVHSATLAVNLLGIDLVKTLILTVKIFESEELAQDVIDTQVLLEHSAAVASKCKELALALNLPDMVEDAMTAGMLHDIGRLILASNFPEKYKEILKKSKPEGPHRLCVLEKETFGVNHGEVGAYLFRIWGLPFDIVNAIHEHCCLRKVKNATISPAILLYVADAFIPFNSNELTERPIKSIDQNYLESVHGGEELINLLNI